MNNLNFIDYSNFLNQKVKAFQVLSNLEDRSIPLDKYRAIITDNLAIDNNSLAIPIQVHSDNVQFIQETGFFKDTDGLLTDKQDIILSLQTADCVPIFLFDKINNIKGLIHSGWKGTKDKIIQKALNIMLDRGSIVSDIFVIVGASIQKCCYEIGDELIPLFNDRCIYIVDDKKYLSLQEQILIDLSELNIQKNNIYIDNRCTFTDDDLSSYRRDKQKAGRMLSFLGIF